MRHKVTTSARWGVLLGAALLLTFASGCASTRSAPSEASHRLRSAVLAGDRTLGFQTRFVSVVRYNPVACAAPAWELRRREGWQRVELIAARDASAEVPMLLSGSEIEAGAQLMGLLEWTGRYATSDGWNHAIVEAQSLSLRPGARNAWP